MTSIKTYRPYLVAAREPTNEDPLTVSCMEDRLLMDPAFDPDIQTAASILGLAIDAGWALNAVGIETPSAPQLALYGAACLLPKIRTIVHGEVCGGEEAAPDVFGLVASSDPAELFKAVSGLDLGIGSSEVGQLINSAKRPSLVVPSAKETAEILASDPEKRVRRIGLASTEHIAPDIIAIQNRDRLLGRKAVVAGFPVYGISFGWLERTAAEAFGNTYTVNNRLLVAASALRHVVTAKARLRHPERGKELNILIHR